jgi:hypothetical protein
MSEKQHHQEVEVGPFGRVELIGLSGIFNTSKFDNYHAVASSAITGIILYKEYKCSTHLVTQ